MASLNERKRGASGGRGACSSQENALPHKKKETRKERINGRASPSSKAGPKAEPRPGRSATSTRVDNPGYGRHVFRLVQRDQSGTTTPVGEQQQVKIALSKPYTLSAAHPNPFRQRATVELTVREAQKVTVAVYDMLGRRVKHLYEGTLAPNTPREFTFDGASHASGLYFLRIKGKSFQATRKATLVK